MAVEASHLNLFPPQILSNREMMMMYGGLPAVTPMTGTPITAAEMMFPMNESQVAKNVMMGADSGLTYANLPVFSRKRSREDSNISINMNQLVSYPNICGGDNRSSSGHFTFLGEDFSSQIQRQQLEVDSFIAQHTEKVRFEIEETRTRYSQRIMAAVEEGITKRLKAKEDEIQKIAKLNWALEERAKSLCVENQIWRDLAQSNEATAHILRHNLEQVLAQVQNVHQNRENTAVLVDDAQSCCGSNDNQYFSGKRHNEGSIIRLCRSCGKEEACVLLMPCRHLCLCSVCGTSQHICPICKTTKSCSLHVNLSS